LPAWRGYLTHPFVTRALLKIFTPVEAQGILIFLLVAAILASVCVVGVIAHYVLERPLSNMMSRMLQRITGTRFFR
jgi:peptidoglycan/LPS O-acetylase OafA/YrhL